MALRYFYFPVMVNLAAKKRRKKTRRTTRRPCRLDPVAASGHAGSLHTDLLSQVGKRSMIRANRLKLPISLCSSLSSRGILLIRLRSLSILRHINPKARLVVEQRHPTRQVKQLARVQGDQCRLVQTAMGLAAKTLRDRQRRSVQRQDPLNQFRAVEQRWAPVKPSLMVHQTAIQEPSPHVPLNLKDLMVSKSKCH